MSDLSCEIPWNFMKISWNFGTLLLPFRVIEHALNLQRASCPFFRFKRNKFQALQASHSKAQGRALLQQRQPATGNHKARNQRQTLMSATRLFQQGGARVFMDFHLLTNLSNISILIWIHLNSEEPSNHLVSWKPCIFERLQDGVRFLPC